MKQALILLGASVLLTVTIHAANTPIAMSGWNRDIIVESTATLPYTSTALPFDVPNNYGFYEAGLPGSTRGLPSSRTFTSLLDGTTVFGFQPYNQNNVLQLSSSASTSGTLTLATPGMYSEISILAAAANSGASQGNFVIHFADSTTSAVLAFNNSDWFFQPNPALHGFGRLGLTSTTAEDNGDSYPELYQTTLSLAGLGLNNRAIVSIDFMDLSTDPRETTAIFAVSGTLIPEPGSLTWLLLGAGALLLRRNSKV